MKNKRKGIKKPTLNGLTDADVEIDMAIAKAYEQSKKDYDELKELEQRIKELKK
jgi:hypothetical protein